MNLFLGADFHLDHANVIKHSNRPYETVEQMNEALVENWNKKVSKKDTTIIIGDFAWKNHGHWISALNGKKILVLGSHDKMNKKYLQCFTDVKMIYYFTIKDRPFVASHCCQRIWEKCHYGSVHVHGHCFDEETEILTKRGFVRHNEINKEDEVLTVNPFNQLLEYQNPNDIFIYDYRGDMIDFHIRGNIISVTPEHDMLGIEGYSNNLYKVKAKDAEIGLNVPLARYALGSEYKESKHFFKMLGLIISDGHFKKEEKGRKRDDGSNEHAGNGIIIYQKTENAEFIRECLNASGAEYKEWQRKIRGVEMSHFYLHAKYVKEFIYPYLTEKNISSRLMGLRGEKFFYFLSGMIFGDGWIMDNKGYNKDLDKANKCHLISSNSLKRATTAYCTGDISLRDNFQHLCLLNGIRSNSKFRKTGFGRGAWNITLSITKEEKITWKETRQYSGKTWCVSVPNGTVVARRNGFIFMTGNSHGRLKTYNLSFDMGVDCNNYQPVSSEELLSMVAKREEEMSLAGRIHIEDRQGKKVKIYYQDDLEFLAPGKGRIKGDH